MNETSTSIAKEIHYFSFVRATQPIGELIPDSLETLTFKLFFKSIERFFHQCQNEILVDIYFEHTTFN